MRYGLFISTVSGLIGYGLLLWLAGPVVLAFTALLVLVGAVVWMDWLARKPLTDTDRECARIDEELERRERTVRRLARQRQREAPIPPVIQKGSGFRAR